MASARTETKVDWDGDGDVSRYGNEEAAHTMTVDQLEKLQEELDADDVVVCLSDPSRRYFRHDIYPDYKKDRTHGLPPINLPCVKQMLRDGIGGFKTKTVPTLEADDVLGIYATHPTLIEGEKVIVTSDKDLNQIPGRHYDPRKDSTFGVDECDANWFFWTQVLTGDPTDGYPGVPGIGPVKADKILLQARSEWTSADMDSVHDGTPRPRIIDFIWPAIVATYAKKGLTPADALVQAQVARICRHTDYDFKEKRSIPWTP